MKKLSFLLYFLPFLPFCLFLGVNDQLFGLQVRELIDVTTLYLIVFFLGLAAYPLMSLLFPSSPDRAYGASRIFGLVLFAYFSWAFFGFFDIPVSSWGLIGVLCLLGMIFLLVISLRDDALLFAKNGNDILIVETLFGSLFLLFLIQASFHPEIYGGEKSMDFSLLFSFYRLEYFPPHDPWASGSVLRYYYWGYFLFAKLLQAARLTPQVGYTVSMALIPALMLGGLYSFILWITKKRFLAIWGSLSIVLASNYQGLVNLWTKSHWDFGYFWSATRIFKTELFAEFPSWSFSFLDLHPHVMCYPFTVLGLLFLWRFWGKKEPFSLVGILCTSLVLGAVFVTNLWDYLILIGLLSLMVLFELKRRVLPFFLVLFFSLLLYLPVIIRMLWGRGNGSEGLSLENTLFNDFSHYFSHYGAWGSLIVGLGLFLFLLYLLKKKKISADLSLKSSLLLFFFSLALMVFSNYFVLIDKINTLFKLNTQAWVLLGCACFLLMRRILRFRPWMKFLCLILPVALTFALIGASVVNALALSSFGRPTWKRPGLDVSAFIKVDDPFMFRFVSRINQQFPGSDIILEPYGKTYDFESNRVSIFTGHPSFLVWAGQHVNQRGMPWAEIFRRKERIDTFYDTEKEMYRCDFLEKENIRFVFSQKVNFNIPCLRLLFKEGDLALYERHGE